MIKYKLYELSVQSPETHVEWFSQWFEKTHKKLAIHLREDFCGTFAMSCEWVKSHVLRTAVGLDLDLNPLSYGEKTHLQKLSVAQKERIWIQQQDVLNIHPLSRDLIVACNFSFCVFKQRTTFLKYLKNCYASLNKSGTLFLEIAGGPGMIEKLKEKKTIKPPRGPKFKYIWDQQMFDPINHHGIYGIHFELEDGSKIKNAFTYDWRLWTIPECKELIAEAGFDDCEVFWEKTHKGKGTGEYVPMSVGDNAYAWVAYIAAHKRKNHRKYSK